MNKISKLFLMLALVSAVGAINAMEEQNHESDSDEEETSSLNGNTIKKELSQPADANNGSKQCKKNCAVCEKVRAAMPSKESVLAFIDSPFNKWTKKNDKGKDEPFFSTRTSRVLGASWKIAGVAGTIYLIKKVVDKCSCQRVTTEIN